ncbi:MAG: hypothetical protein H0V82_09210 [Candidatus Protochlamydia sp.]|nr:hypothetical protein [Candidatus Protochlamydia sp.]
MPVNKKDDKKNAPVQKRDSAIVPKKEEAGKGGKPEKTSNTQSSISNKPVTALSTQGKKKKPNELNS